MAEAPWQPNVNLNNLKVAARLERAEQQRDRLLRVIRADDCSGARDMEQFVEEVCAAAEQIEGERDAA